MDVIYIIVQTIALILSQPITVAIVLGVCYYIYNKLKKKGEKNEETK